MIVSFYSRIQMLRLPKFLLFSLLFAQITLSMAPQAPAAQDFDQAEFDASMAEARVAIGQIPAILQEVELDRRNREEAEERRIDEAYIDQNTILFSTPPNAFPFRIAFFKRDLVAGGLFLANMASEVAMYKLIKHFRVQRIKEYMFEHDQEVENLLTHIKNEQLKLDYAVEDKKMTEKEAAVEKKKVLALIKKFADTEHTLKNALLSKEIIATIGGRLLAEKALDSLEKVLITPQVWPLPYYQASYEYNANGERVRCADRPISVVSLVRFANAVLFNSRDMMNILAGDLGDFLSSKTESGAEMANEFFGFGIPKFVFNPVVKTVTRLTLQVTTLVWAAKKFDAKIHIDWLTYLEKNHQKLLSLIQEYKALKNSATPDDIKKLKIVEAQIEAFIKAGHESSAWNFTNDYRAWFQSKNESSGQIDRYQNIALCGVLALKGYQIYRAFIAPRPDARPAAN
jgi:hypothetical protein